MNSANKHFHLNRILHQAGPWLLVLLLLGNPGWCWGQRGQRGQERNDTLVAAPLWDDTTDEDQDSIIIMQERPQSAYSSDVDTVLTEPAGWLKDRIKYVEREEEDAYQEDLLRNVPDSVTTKLRKDDAFWYANFDFSKPKKDDNNRIPFWRTETFRTILIVIIICCFVGVIIMYLASNRIGLFRRSQKIAQDEDPDEALPENIFEINYGREIEKAQAAGNYRLAVRLHFLQLLRTLSDKHIIQYTPERTNFDYLLQLQKSNWYQDFFRLTRHYEYIWYGQFAIDQYRYEQISQDFGRAVEKLKY